jgi:hypothetical protein
MIVKRTSKNTGIIDNKVCHFLESSMLHIKDDQYHVPDNDVFYKSEKLQSGIICKRTVIEQKIGKFISGTQEFFQVIDSAVENINIGDLVIVSKNSASEFIAYNETLAFAQEQNVLLVANSALGVIPGPLYLILEPSHDGYDNQNIEKIKSAQGYYFDHYTMKLVIKGKLSLIVAKKDIKAIEDSSLHTTLSHNQ